MRTRLIQDAMGRQALAALENARNSALRTARQSISGPAPTGGTATAPTFDRRAVGGWLLAHGKITSTEPQPTARLVPVRDYTQLPSPPTDPEGFRRRARLCRSQRLVCRSLRER